MEKSSESAPGPSSKGISSAEKSPETEAVKKEVAEDGGREEDGVDLEKGIKPAGNGEAEGSDAGGARGGGGQECGEGEDADEDDSQCRVCHLVFDSGLGTNESMELGCHCKEDLAIAHRDCAEAWFKIKGNRICEICGATAQNIVGADEAGFMEQWNNATSAADSSESHARCWQSLSLCNFFLACMVVTFILLWLFHVTIN